MALQDFFITSTTRSVVSILVHIQWLYISRLLPVARPGEGQRLPRPVARRAEDRHILPRVSQRGVTDRLLPPVAQWGEGRHLHPPVSCGEARPSSSSCRCHSWPRPGASCCRWHSGLRAGASPGGIASSTTFAAALQSMLEIS